MGGFSKKNNSKINYPNCPSTLKSASHKFNPAPVPLLVKASDSSLDNSILIFKEMEAHTADVSLTKTQLNFAKRFNDFYKI